VAFFGAVWSARLAAELSAVIPVNANGAVADATQSLSRINALPPALQETVLGAFSRAMDTTFLIAVPIMMVAFILAFTLPEINLRTTHSMEEGSEDDTRVPFLAVE
jgi:hypothetical protein